MPSISSNELNEIWLQAMDTLIQQRLSGLDYDKTYKGKVLKDKGNGLYLIEQDGVIKFDAQSYNDAAYKEGDEVYILVPQGDYSAVKVIVGKSQKIDNDNLINYVSPVNHMVVAAELDKHITFRDCGIQANGDIQQYQIGQINLADIGLEHNYIYTSLGLSVNVKTLFSKIDMAGGNYGLFLRVVMESGKVYDAILDSSEMFGNPYNYMTYFQQSKIFDLSSYEESIAHIGVYLYQQNNFTFWNNDVQMRYTPKFIGAGDNLQPKYDILVEDIKILLGENIIPIADNTFTLQVIGDKETRYKYTEGTMKSIRSTWYNKSEANEFIGFSDGVVDSSYDEDKYLKAIETEWAGAQVPTSSNIAPLKESLQIYHDSTLVQQAMDSLYRYVDIDIYKIITNLNSYLSKFNFTTNTVVVDNHLNLLTTIKPLVAPEGEEIGWSDEYLLYLQQINTEYNKLVEDITTNIATIEFPARFNTDFNKMYNQWQLELYPNIQNWFTNLIATIDTDNDLHGEVRAYINRQKRLFESCAPLIAETFNTIKSLIDNDYEKSNILTARLADKNITTFTDEYDAFKKINADKYCIYWYRLNAQSMGDNWSGPGWERITWKTETPGMPEIDEINNCYYKYSNSLASFIPSVKMKSDKLKAILIFNHETYNSNILEFINETPPSNPNEATEQDTITILHGKHSQDSYQKYSSMFTLISLSDAITNRELIVDYTSIDKNITSNQALVGSMIYWYIPLQATMLNYNQARLQELGFTNLDVLLTTLTDPIEIEYYTKYKRNEFACFFKEIVNSETDKKFYYLIETFYSQTANNNTIYCRVEKDKQTYETSINFTFSQYGTSGTQYTLSIVPVGVHSALGSKEGSPLIVEVNFTGFEGAVIENPPAIDMYWLIDGGWTPQIDTLDAQTLLDEYDIHPRVGASYFMISRAVDFSLCPYNVLVASVNWDKITDDIAADMPITLAAYYPVAQSKGPYYLDGPSVVSYDNMGTNPEYVHNAYRLFYLNNNTELTDITWEIRHYDKTGAIQDISEIAQYLPKLHYQAEASILYPEPGYYLRPVSTFVDKINTYSVIIALQNDEPIYAQPIYCMQNQWGSSLLNAWDEKLTIDEKNGTILSSMIGAGFKDEANRFHGVLMGDVGAKADVDSVKTGVGIYGFHDGVQSFGFNIDGTAFIGKYGNGRIEFNGNKGWITSPYFQESHGLKIDVDTGSIYIKGAEGNTTPYFQVQDDSGTEIIRISDKNYFLQSSNYEKDAEGMRIDLTNGKIDAHNLRISSKNFILSSTSSPYFQLMDNEENILMKVADNEYYLQTSDFSTDNKTGIKLNLGTGKIDGYKFTLTGYDDASESYLTISSKPEIIMHLETDTYNTDMLKINASEFVLQSPDWSNNVEVETEDNVLYATLTRASALNVRSGPGTGFSIVGSVSKGEKKRIYGEELGWYQLDEDGTRYASKKLNNAIVWDESTGSITTTVTKSQGMQFDVRRGSILLQKPKSEQIFSIDATAPSYPLQIGSINKDGQRNFRVGWDGSLYGGSDNSWWIDAKGNAHFNNVTANSGYLGGCRITYVGVSGGSWGLDGDDATFNSILMPNSKGALQRLTLKTMALPAIQVLNDHQDDRSIAISRQVEISSWMQLIVDEDGWVSVDLKRHPAGTYSVAQNIRNKYKYLNEVEPARTYYYVGFEAATED